jgi:PAS domain S-box-containing protein
MPAPDNRLFYDAFNASPIGIALEDLEGRPLFVNPALCSMLGFSDEEMRRKHCLEFSPPEDAEKDWALFQQLRAGSIDHYQIEKRYFRKNGPLLWGRLSISLLNRPSPVVVAMVEDITDKKKAQNDLHESEERLRLAVQAGRMFAYSWDAATDVIERSGGSGEILGIEEKEAATGKAIWAMVHPKDKERLKATLKKLTIENPTLQITYRIVRPDGAIAWLERNSRAYFDERGSLKRIVGMVVNVTERKQAEDMTRKLIEVQEQERARVGRELHDDINQRLSLLAVEVQAAKKNFSDSKETRRLLTKVRKRISEVSSAVQSISHKLHSSQLEYLGLAATMRSFCRDFASRRTVEIDFKSDDVPKTVPYELSLCLFRVLQEALQNAAKHSEVRRFAVELGYATNQLHLIVSDRGIGFEVETTMNKGGGLGLISMRERVRLVNGTISIESKPMRGTTIRIWVPLSAENPSQRIAV